MRQLLPDGQHLVQLFLIFHKSEPAVAVFRNVVNLFFGVGIVDGGGDAPYPHDGHIADHPLQPGLAENRHLITPVHTARKECIPQIPGPFAILPPGK